MRRRRRGKKKKALQRHSRLRAAERYDLFIDRDLRGKIVRSIQKHGPYPVKFVRKQSNRVTVWDVTLEDKTVRAVYDKNRHEIVTVLPPKQK